MDPTKDFIENPNWRKHPDKSRGVTWDAKCSKCGFEITDAKFDEGFGLGLTKDNRRLRRCVYIIRVNERTYRSDEHDIICTVCAPE